MAFGKSAIQRIRDPLHNLIEFAEGSDEFERMLWSVVQTRPFQRLRRVKQLGFSEFVYPGATHSRFSHSLGVFHTARKLMDVIARHVPVLEQSKVRPALAAALVHDLGHGAFSHAFEKVGERLNLKMADHENVSDALIRDSEVTQKLNSMGRGFADDVADVIQGVGKKTVYQAVVSSQFDADRLDYMRRDRMMTGTQHSAIDFEWLLANLEIGDIPIGVDEKPLGTVETFVLGPKAHYAAETYVLGLFQLYPTVYLHKTTRGAEKIFVELLAHTLALVQDGSWQKTGLPRKHPLVQFAKEPNDLNRALALDDTVVWGALPLMLDADDKLVAEFSLRLRDRELFKCIDIRALLSHQLDPMASGDAEKQAIIDMACARISLKLTTWRSDLKEAVPRVIIDDSARTPYKSVGDTKGPLDRINMRTSDGMLVDLKERSSVVAALQPFKLDRAYIADGDVEAQDRITSLIQDEVS